MQKMMKIFAWIPILNLFVIIMTIIPYIKEKQIKKSILPTIIWAGVMFVGAIIRMIVTIVFAQTDMEIIIDIITPITLYASVTIGALIFLKNRASH